MEKLGGHADFLLGKERLVPSQSLRKTFVRKAMAFHRFLPMGMSKEALKHVPLFSDLTDQELDLLAGSGRRRKLPAKNVVFQEGEPGEVLLIILSGKVKVLLSGKNGEEFILAILGSGIFFGEMALLESAPRSASVITLEPCEFLLLSQNDLTTLITNHPAIALKILKHLSQRLRKTNEQVGGLVMCDIYSRLCRCLLNLAEVQVERAKHHLLVISNRPSFQELAKMVGCSRETLSRTIKHLKDNGCLTVTRNAIFINKVWE